MFTGIIERVGVLRTIHPGSHSATLVIDLGELANTVALGDSVAVNGACLTATRVERSLVAFDVISETIALTSLSTTKVGDRVNIERAMPANGRFHGHFVSGHVDGTARLTKKVTSPGQTTLSFGVGEDLAAQMIAKGSIAIDGVSLTLTEVKRAGFSVAIIPHTLSATTLPLRSIGDLLNIEVDQLGKWVKRILSSVVPELAAPEQAENKGITKPSSGVLSPDDLRRYGLG